MTSTAPLRARFHHVSLSVADLGAQRRWYAEALGFTEVIEQFELPEPPVRTVVLQSHDGVRVELMLDNGRLFTVVPLPGPEAGQLVEIAGHAGTVRTVEPILGERELRLVVRLDASRAAPA